ncbi:tail fiber protein [Rhodobacter capsulatus]|uniref:tail fiber protein n=1 Tax=Rhodobacter capsulatus TaxID=1061 RepID=UPI004025F423
MADLPETDTYPAGVYQFETTTPAVGGAPNRATMAGAMNVPLLELANRTRWLKTRVDQLLAAVVAASTTVAGIVRLSTSTSSTATDMAATPSAVKAANDNANTRALQTTTITAAGLATGGGSLGADRTITVPAATQAEAEAGTVDTKAMTPLKVAQAIAAAIAGGTLQAGSAILSAISALATAGIIVRTAAGTVETRAVTGGTGVTVTNGNGVAGNPTITLTIATQAEAEAGTIDTKGMTPLKVAQAIAAAIAGGTLQAGSAILSAISALATAGIIVRTAAGTVAARTIAAGTGMTVTNGDGVAGNPTVALTIATQAEAEAGTIDTKGMTPLKVAQAIAAAIAGGTLQAGSAILSAISALATAGIIVRTAAGTVAARTITAGTGVTVANGNGVAGNPTIALTIATQAEAEAGTIDTKGMTPLKVAQAIAAMTPGYGQTWQAVARTAGTSYQNTTTRPITVMAYSEAQGSTMQVSTNGTTWVTLASLTTTDTNGFVEILIPVGHYYRYTGTWSQFAELR